MACGALDPALGASQGGEEALPRCVAARRQGKAVGKWPDPSASLSQT